MNKKYLLAVGITLLFLGVSVQPAIATLQQKDSDTEPVIYNAKELVAQLQVLINGILHDYGHIPIIRTLANIIYNIIIIVWRILYCSWLVISMILCSITIVYLTLFDFSLLDDKKKGQAFQPAQLYA